MAFEPLTPDLFLLRILVPHVAKELLKEDCNITNDDVAVDLLRDSSPYGLFMFPHEDDSPDSYVEEMMLERARKRKQQKHSHQEPSAQTPRPRPKPLGTKKKKVN